MIKIVAKMNVKAGNETDFTAAAKELVEKSAAEPGNVSYSLNVSQADPHVFAIIECWKDQDAIEFHNNTPHFTGILPKLAAMCEGEMTVDVYDEVEF